jgi:hypothetical protein
MFAPMICYNSGMEASHLRTKNKINVNGKRILAGPPVVLIQFLEGIQNCHSSAETIGCRTDPGRDRVRRGDTERLTQLIAKFALPGQSCQ